MYECQYCIVCAGLETIPLILKHQFDEAAVTCHHVSAYVLPPKFNFQKRSDFSLSAKTRTGTLRITRLLILSFATEINLLSPLIALNSLCCEPEQLGNFFVLCVFCFCIVTLILYQFSSLLVN